MDTNSTRMGKKSDSIPGMVNSIIPVLLEESMTGSRHSRICFFESNLYSPATSPTTGAPTPLLRGLERGERWEGER